MDRKLESITSTEYTVNYRNIKYPRLEFKTGTLQLILPKGYKKEKELLEKHRRWIHYKQQAIQAALKQSKTRKLDETRTVDQLKGLVTDLVRQYQTELETRINKAIFRKMKTKWASHSQNNNLTVNTLLRHLPENLVAYVVFHEVVHAKQGRKHERSFWKLISRKFEDYQSRENDLLIYWFVVQKRIVYGNKQV